MKNKKIREALVYLVVATGLFAFTFSDRRPAPDPSSPTDGRRSLSYTEMMKAAGDGRLSDVVVMNEEATGRVSVNGAAPVPFRTDIPEDARPSDVLVSRGVDVRAGKPPVPSLIGQLLVSWFPSLLVVGLVFYSMRRMSSRGGPMSMGKSRATRFVPSAEKIGFDDVGGIESAKEDVAEIAEYLKDPARFSKLGGRVPVGVLLVGPPGTGKTLLARAIAGEAGVPFFIISGSDFVEMFVGVGASRVRDMFEQARKTAPCIIFIDEIDAVGRARHSSTAYGGNDERENTLNQLLVEMDGFAKTEGNAGVIVMAATNRPDILDPALLRAGRFDRRIDLVNPGYDARIKILTVHFRKVAVHPGLDVSVVARGTPGFSGADLANLVNEAALLAAKRKLDSITLREVEDAKDKIIMGAENRTISMTPKEMRLTAYHEAAHALCGVREQSYDPIHKATIVPRGRALGMVVSLPEGDRVSTSRARLEAKLRVLAAGREGERLVFGDDEVTTGASMDIEAATEIATSMVTKWGMSAAIGPVAHASDTGPFSGNRAISEETAKTIDDEIRALLADAAWRTRRRLMHERDALDRLAMALLEKETLEGGEIIEIVGEDPGPFIEPHD